MKIIIFGYGSAGKRHAKNLVALDSSTKLVIADPRYHNEYNGEMAIYTDWQECLNKNENARAAIIASPFDCHLEQMAELVELAIPFLCEKPLWGRKQNSARADEIINTANELELRSAICFQYRYHRESGNIRALAQSDILEFHAEDNLLDKYGNTAPETMGAHPIDTALWLMGEVIENHLHTDGVKMWGWLAHKRGLSRYDVRMHKQKRISDVGDGKRTIALYPDDGAYVRLLDDWLGYIVTGRHSGKLPTLAEGLAVSRVLSEIKETNNGNQNVINK